MAETTTNGEGLAQRFMTRKHTMDIHVREGATRGQITGMYMCENFIILLLSSLLGLFTACQFARLICSAIGKNMGVNFFYIGSSTYIKMLITLILSVIISIIFNVYMNISHDYNKAIKVKKDKKYNAEKYAASGKKINIKEINNRNFIYQTHIRFMHTNGFIPNMFIRLFTLVMTAVMVLCAINMHTAYKAYDVFNGKKTDLTENVEIDWGGFNANDLSQNKFDSSKPYTVTYKVTDWAHNTMSIIIMKILMNIRKRCKREKKVHLSMQQQIIKNQQSLKYIINSG